MRVRVNMKILNRRDIANDEEMMTKDTYELGNCCIHECRTDHQNDCRGVGLSYEMHVYAQTGLRIRTTPKRGVRRKKCTMFIVDAEKQISMDNRFHPCYQN